MRHLFSVRVFGVFRGRMIWRRARVPRPGKWGFFLAFIDIMA